MPRSPHWSRIALPVGQPAAGRALNWCSPDRRPADQLPADPPGQHDPTSIACSRATMPPAARRESPQGHHLRRDGPVPRSRTAVPSHRAPQRRPTTSPRPAPIPLFGPVEVNMTTRQRRTMSTKAKVSVTSMAVIAVVGLAVPAITSAWAEAPAQADTVSAPSAVQSNHPDARCDEVGPGHGQADRQRPHIRRALSAAQWRQDEQDRSTDGAGLHLQPQPGPVAGEQGHRHSLVTSQQVFPGRGPHSATERV